MSEGGVPASWLHHKRYDEQPIKHVPGLREKFLSIVDRQSEGKVLSFLESNASGDGSAFSILFPGLGDTRWAAHGLLMAQKGFDRVTWQDIHTDFKMVHFEGKNIIGPFWYLCAYLVTWPISVTAVLSYFEVHLVSPSCGNKIQNTGP